MFILPAVSDHLPWETTKFSSRFIQVFTVFYVLKMGLSLRINEKLIPLLIPPQHMLDQPQL